jgi:hypothetical protein
MTNAFTAFGEENPQANALDIEARKSWLHNMSWPVWLRRTKLWRKQG